MCFLDKKYLYHAEVIKDDSNMNRNIECIQFLITDRPDTTTMNCLITWNDTTASIIDIKRKALSLREDSTV